MGRGAEDARAVLEAAVRVLDEGWVRARDAPRRWRLLTTSLRTIAAATRRETGPTLARAAQYTPRKRPAQLTPMSTLSSRTVESRQC